MDTAWARAQLMEFHQMIELVPAASTPGTTRRPGNTMTARPEGEIVYAATVVEQILDRLLPDWRSFRGRGIDGWSGHREATQRTLSVLALDEELQAKLADTALGWRPPAEGCFSALRNPGSHDPHDELAEHEALEQLAAFSVLARWVDGASVVA